MRLSLSHSPPEWLPTSRTTAGSDLPNETFCARSGPAWTPVSQARNRQRLSSRVGVHPALTVRDVRVAGMVPALYGARGSALGADQDRLDALCRGRNASTVTSALLGKTAGAWLPSWLQALDKWAAAILRADASPGCDSASARSVSAARKCSGPVIGPEVARRTSMGVIPRPPARRSGLGLDMRKPGPAGDRALRLGRPDSAD
jgi:hypothetical protein